MTRVWAVFLQEIFSYTRRSFDSKPAFRVRWETSLGRISLGISIPLYKGQDVYCALHTREMWTGSNISPFIQAHIILLITHNCIHINGSFKTSIHQTQHLELHICLKMSYPKHLKTVNYRRLLGWSTFLDLCRTRAFHCGAEQEKQSRAGICIPITESWSLILNRKVMS